MVWMYACVSVVVFLSNRIWRICRALCIYSMRRSPGSCLIQFEKYTTKREWANSKLNGSQALLCVFCSVLFCFSVLYDNEFIIFKVQCALVRDSPQLGCTQFSFSVLFNNQNKSQISFSFCVQIKKIKSFLKWNYTKASNLSCFSSQ